MKVLLQLCQYQTKAKMRGRKKSAEEIDAIRKKNTGKKRSIEVRAKISQMLIERGKQSEETRARHRDYKKNWWAQKKLQMIQASGQKSIFE